MTSTIRQIAFVKSWADTYKSNFYERILPENERNLVGLQAAARDWRRSECFNVLSNRELNIDTKSNLQCKMTPHAVNAGESSSDSDVWNLSPSSVFATAHHCDDQHETMLLKFLRGAHITHLQPVSAFK